MSDPYWSPPETEAARFATIREGIRVHVADPSRILLAVGKSSNLNVVLFKYTPEGPSIVTAEWLSLDPADARRHVARGNASLRAPLNAVEDALFGVRVEVVGGRYMLRMNHAALASRPFELVMNGEGNPVVLGVVGTRTCVLHHAYVAMKRGPLPDVEYVNLYGLAPEDGSMAMERMAV